MILLVPLGFGFTYMMIKLANEAERKSKLAKKQVHRKLPQSIFLKNGLTGY